MGTAQLTCSTEAGVGLRERMRERELTAFGRGFRLALAMALYGKRPTITEIAALLGYADHSGASRIMGRTDLPGVYYDEDTGQFGFALDPRDMPW